MDPSANIFEARYTTLGKKLGKNLFGELTNARTFKPKLTLAKVLAFGIAALVHGVTLATGIFGLILLWTGWPNILSITAGLAALGIAMVLWPRKCGQLGGDDLVLSREEYPATYKLVDRIAEALGLPQVDAIILGSAFNAGYSELGWRRKRVLYLGLPLLMVLDKQEVVALLAHELGHGVNGDPRRAFFIGSAIDALIRWHGLLQGAYLETGKRRGPVLWTMFLALIAFLFVIAFTRQWLVEMLSIIGLTLPVLLYMIALSWVAVLGIKLLLHLLWRDMQRAEYLADDLAARTGGTKATLSMLDKMHLTGVYLMVVHHATLNNKTSGLLDALRRSVTEVPEREWERVRRIERLEGSRLDATHPPTPYRIDLLRAYDNDPYVSITNTEYEELMTELLSQKERIEAELVDLHEAYYV